MKWPEIATRAIDFMGETRRGDKEAALAKACEHIAKVSKGEVKIRPPTLRTYLLASRFIDEFYRVHGDRRLTEVIAGLPAIAVEVLARWYGHDPKGVVQTLRDAAVHRPPSVRHLRDIERQAAAKHVGRSGRPAHGRRLKNNYREVVIEEIESFGCVWPAGASPPGWHRTDATTDESRELTDPTGAADFVGRVVEGREIVSCAALIVGPYSRVEFYPPRAAEWVLKGLGMLHYYDQVALVLPHAAPAEKFIGLLAGARAAKGRLRLLVDTRSR